MELNMKRLMTALILILAVTALAACVSNGGDEPGTIVGDVFIDCNKDGECNCEEVGFADVSIQIFVEECGGVPLQTIDTDDEGKFEFTRLEPGPYCVMSNLKPNCGGHFPTTTITREVVLESGQVLELESFGYTAMGQ
jgi:hypothetical protein